MVEKGGKVFCRGFRKSVCTALLLAPIGSERLRRGGFRNIVKQDAETPKPALCLLGKL